MTISLNKKLYLSYPFLFKWQDKIILFESLSLFLLIGMKTSKAVEKNVDVS